MAKTRYRSIVKVLCDDCRTKVDNRQRIDTKCPKCNFIKHNNVQEHRLKAYTEFLDKEHPNWVFWNLYYYVKGGKGDLKITYKNGAERFVP